MQRSSNIDCIFHVGCQCKTHTRAGAYVGGQEVVSSSRVKGAHAVATVLDHL